MMVILIRQKILLFIRNKIRDGYFKTHNVNVSIKIMVMSRRDDVLDVSNDVRCNMFRDHDIKNII